MNETCEHCGLSIPPGVRLVEEFAGQQAAFCCRGCQGAFRIIHGAGLGRFYRERDWDRPGVPDGAFAAPADPLTLERHVRRTAEGHEFTFLLEGIRCATCVWLNEKVLSGLPGIRQARINYASHRARVSFDPERITPARIFAAVSELGYLPRPDERDQEQRSRQAERRSLLVRFGTAAFLSLQLMGFSLALYSGYFQGMDDGARSTLQALAGAVATPVVFYCGAPFLAGAWRSLRNRLPNMDLLIALGVLAAYGFSIHGLFSGGEVYFDTAAMIVTLILLGRLLETGARHRAAGGIERLLAMAPASACRLDAGGPVTVAAADLRSGDLVLVAPGERLPVDGAVVEGTTELDESVVSGEPMPRLRRPGDRVVAGSLNLSAAITLRATGTAAESFVARIARLVEEAQSRRAPLQRLADRVAAGFVPAVVVLAVGTGIYWEREAGPEAALLHAVAVLVVACPCALGLATPAAVMVATAAAARRGILFRGGDILERVGRLDRVAFDKTGTLTGGRPRVVDLLPAPGTAPGQLLAAAARVENGSAHPLARGILEEARRRRVQVPLAAGGKALPGLGVHLAAGGDELLAGTAGFLAAAGVAVPPQPGDALHTEVHVAANGAYLGVILLEDGVRPEAPEAVAGLRRLGLRTALLTGDGEAAGRRLAEDLDIGEAAGGLVPEDKANWIEARRGRGERILMVGDGINDAPALAAADVGCALGGSTDVALESSDLVLTRPDLSGLVAAVRMGRRALRVIRQNLFWAFAYNLVALPLAASGRLAPIHAAAAMALSSVCVVLNSLRLARDRLE